MLVLVGEGGGVGVERRGMGGECVVSVCVCVGVNGCMVCAS